MIRPRYIAMASTFTARTFVRSAFRATQSTVRTPLIRSSGRFVAPTQAFRQQARRGYASEAGSSSGGSGAWVWLLGLAAVSGGGYYAYSQGLFAGEDAKSKVFTPEFADYQKVYDAIAKRLVDEDDYDDGSYGPVVLRLAWHASGT